MTATVLTARVGLLTKLLPLFQIGPDFLTKHPLMISLSQLKAHRGRAVVFTCPKGGDTETLTGSFSLDEDCKTEAATGRDGKVGSAEVHEIPLCPNFFQSPLRPELFQAALMAALRDPASKFRPIDRRAWR